MIYINTNFALFNFTFFYLVIAKESITKSFTIHLILLCYKDSSILSLLFFKRFNKNIKTLDIMLFNKHLKLKNNV